MSWPDVGIISLSAALTEDSATPDNLYLGSDTLTAVISNLGRFVASHFRLTTSSVTQTCTNFSYMEQTIDLAINIAAQGVGDISLLNYNSGSAINANEVKMSDVSSSLFASNYVVKSLEDHTDIGTVNVSTMSPSTNTTTLNALFGVFDLMLNVPLLSVGSKGYTPIEVDVTANPWLQFAWGSNGIGSADSVLPPKNVTFGQFRGNDRVIYWRESL